MEAYDYIVVRAGTAGCVLAARLSSVMPLIPNATILAIAERAAALITGRPA